jgi:hypothetical protein
MSGGEEISRSLHCAYAPVGMTISFVNEIFSFQIRLPNKCVIPTGGVMGLWPTQADENQL